MNKTKIEWTERTWNPITGCSKISEGCAHCYAERMAHRLRGRYGYPSDYPFRVTFHPDRLTEPLRWKKPTTIFVCSMGDIGHPDINEPDAKRVWKVMEEASWHRFLVLTKRPAELGGLLHWWRYRPSNHIWLGTTCENQWRADERIPELLATFAVHRWVSLEPLLEPIDITNYLTNASGFASDALMGIVVGCESGPRRRPMQLEWAEDIVRQCREAQVPCFVKQLPINGRVSHDPAEWPEALRVRQLPWKPQGG
jgi:protein gp37